MSPAAVKPPASHTGLGRPRVNAAHPPGVGVQLSQPRQAQPGRHPPANPEHHQQHLGRSALPLWSRALVERQDPDRHLDVRRLGDRACALPCSPARRECSGARGQGPQQGPRAVEVAAQAPAPNALPQGASGQRQPVELRPALPGLLPRLRRHGTLEVLPVLQRRLLPRAHDHGAELDEPDQDGLTRASGTRRRPPGDLACTGVPPDLRRVAARPAGLATPTANTATGRWRASSSPAPAPPVVTTR